MNQQNAQDALVALVLSLLDIEDVDAGIEHGFQVAGNIAGDVWREALAASLEIGTKLKLKRDYIVPDDGARIPAGARAIITYQNPGGAFYIDFAPEDMPDGLDPYGWNDFSLSEIIGHFTIRAQEVE